MFTIKEILQKVRVLEIKTKQLTQNLFTGEYHSAFKGRGMSFKEVREYTAGDDIRFIDWNVSARFGHPFSKVFEEERDLTVMILVDVSASTLFGASGNQKKNTIIEVAAVLIFSAISNGDKAGAILYSDKVERYIPPKKGKAHALYILRELLSAEPNGKQTRLSAALHYFNNTSKQKSIAFILSDFLDVDYGSTLKVTGARHDVIGIKVYDKADRQLPEMGMVHFRDAETGVNQWVDTTNKLVKFNHEKEFFKVTDYANFNFKKSRSVLLHVRTDEDYVKVLQKFFTSRGR